MHSPTVTHRFIETEFTITARTIRAEQEEGLTLEQITLIADLVEGLDLDLYVILTQDEINRLDDAPPAPQPQLQLQLA